MGKTNPRTLARRRRRAHVRKHVVGTAMRPRLSVYRSNGQIYVQVIDDRGLQESAVTLAAASSLDADLRDRLEGLKKSQVAEEVGKLIASRCGAKGIQKVVFDRNGFLYHGRVRALAEGARAGGLVF